MLQSKAGVSGNMEVAKLSESDIQDDDSTWIPISELSDPALQDEIVAAAPEESPITKEEVAEAAVKLVEKPSGLSPEYENYVNHLADCLKPALDKATASRNTKRHQQIMRVAVAESAMKALEEGNADDDATSTMRDLNHEVGAAAADSIVQEDFHEALMDTMGADTITSSVVNKFTSVLKHTAEACGDGAAAEADILAEDERQLLTSDSGNMTTAEARVAMDLALDVGSRCQDEVLDVDFMVDHGLELDSDGSCSSLVQKSQSKVRRHAKTRINAHLSSVLALHDDSNKLGYTFMQHVEKNGLLMASENHNDPDAAEAYLSKLKEALHVDIPKAKLARLLYLDSKHYEVLHGVSKDSYCRARREVLENKKDHWTSQSAAISAYDKCLCEELQPALVCDVKHEKALQPVKAALHEKAASLRQADGRRSYSNESLGTSGNAFGPCSPPIVCQLCANGNNCIRTDGTSSQDMFGEMKDKLLDSPAACMSGSCGIEMGSPAGTCGVKFVLEIGAKLSDCSSKAAIFTSFHVYLAAKLCMGGPVSDFADLFGWDACMTIAELQYYPFVGKLAGNLNLPIPLPPPVGVRAQLSGSGPVHEMSRAVTNHIQTSVQNPHTIKWVRALLCFQNIWGARYVSAYSMHVC